MVKVVIKISAFPRAIFGFVHDCIALSKTTTGKDLCDQGRKNWVIIKVQFVNLILSTLQISPTLQITSYDMVTMKELEKQFISSNPSITLNK
jgi:hypothetical protein